MQIHLSVLSHLKMLTAASVKSVKSHEADEPTSSMGLAHSHQTKDRGIHTVRRVAKRPPWNAEVVKVS